MDRYGGFWRRVVAYLLDWLILTIVGGMLSGALFGSVAGLAAFAPMQEPSGLLTGAFMGIQGLTLVLNWLYFAVLESSSMQGTLGKRALGMIVTDLNGQRIGFGRATGRYFAEFLSVIVLMIGFVMVAFTARKQGLHDMLAGTLVYKASPADTVTTDAAVFE